MSQVNTSMNFLPEDYVEKRQAARAAVVFIGLLLVVVGGIVGAYMYTQWQNKAVFEEHDRVTAAFDDASKQIAEARTLEQEKAHMIAKAEVASTLMERVQRSALLRELTRPRGVNFVSLELKTKETQAPVRPESDLEKQRRKEQGLSPDAPKAPTREVTVDLIGTAKNNEDVAQYIAELDKSPLVQDVNLLFSEEFQRDKSENKEVLRRFHVQMKVNPDADLRGLSALTDAASSK